MTSLVKRTGIVQHLHYAEHCEDSGHLECSERLSVLYFSIHQTAAYPGGGKFREIWKGKSEDNESYHYRTVHGGQELQFTLSGGL